MALPNPTLDPPRLTAHSSSRSNSSTAARSRSPTRSPARTHDPFIRDLSPTKTLRAFAAESRGRPNDVLLRSITDASPGQRVLGTKVAQACADLRSWTREMDAWQWPGSFDVPDTVRRKQQRSSAMTLLSLAASTTDSENAADAADDEQPAPEYWGSLPAATVRAHEHRLDAICLAFDTIDFDELKRFVLSAHDQAGGALAAPSVTPSSSIGTIGAATDLKRLDDFTALITATILHALPYLPRLTALLDTWATRLAILRAAPNYLRDLRRARTDLDHGWAALAVSPAHSRTAHNAQFSGENLEEMRGLISSQVYSLGKRLDRFLDTLEGRQEVVPDAWIDDFEELEAEYGEWVVKAERKVLEGEWRSMKEQVKETVLKMAREDDARDGAVGEDGGVDGDDEEDEYVEERDVRVPGQNGSSRGVGSTAPPVSAVTRGAGGSAGLKPALGSTIITTISGPLTNTVPATSSKASSVTSATGGGREKSAIGPTSRERTPSPSPTRKVNTSSPSKPRHVPIVINYTDPDAPFELEHNASLDNSAKAATTTTSQSISDLTPTTTITTNTNTTTTTTAPPLTRSRSKTPSEAASTNTTVKQRAAFLNGDIERSESLVKIKSAPIVRPFEHASNAFTRLFKRDTPAMGIDEVRNRYNESRNGQRGGSVDEGVDGNATSKRPGNNEAVAAEKSGSMSSSLNSGSGSASGKTSSSPTGGSRKSKNKEAAASQRLEYMDMVRAPSPASRKSVDKAARGRDPTRSQRMAYGDLVMAAGSDVDPERLKTPPPPPPRKSTESKPEQVRGLEQGAAKKVPVPPVPGPSTARSSDRRFSLDETKRSKSSPPSHRTQDSLTALPMRPKSRQDNAGTSSSRRSYEREGGTGKPAPATYRPTGLFSEPLVHASQTQTRQRTFPDTVDFPADWPLSSAAATPVETGERDYFPPAPPASSRDASSLRDGATLPSDAFEQFFVRTLPSRPALVEKDFGHEVRRPSSAPGFRTTTREMKGGGLVRPVSVVQEEGESEVFDAEADVFDDGVDGWDGDGDGEADNAAAYFGRHFGEGTPRASSIALDTMGFEDVELGDVQQQEEEGEEADDDEDLKRASIASIESHARDEVRSIEIPRRSFEERSLDAPISEPRTPRAADANEAEDENGETSPLTYKRTMVFPSPPPSLPTRASSLRSSMSSVKSSDSPSAVKQRLSTSSPLAEDGKTERTAPPPLNTAMPKQRVSTKPRSRGSMGDHPRSPTTTTMTSTTTTFTTSTSSSRRKKSDPPLKPGEDTFDRHVSEVLDRVRAPIRFKTRPGSTTPVAKAAALSTAIGSKVKTNNRASSGTNMTLAPAETSPIKTPTHASASSSSAAEPEVKLYHLTQAGKAEPIKLYVRLVGEGERVMVRVGGGWADLADYLRQYAEHHGSRTVSEGALELQSAPGSAGGPGSATSKRAFSGPPASATAVEPKSRSPISPTPASASAAWGAGRYASPPPPTTTTTSSTAVNVGARNSTTSTTTTTTTSSTAATKPDPWNLGRNASRPRLWLGSDSDDDDDDAAQQSPTLGRQQTPWEDRRPRSVAAFAGGSGGGGGGGGGGISSRPSTADGGGGGVRGLDGRQSRASELPEQKARWVEGMIEKAMKSASAGAGAGGGATPPVEREKAFGDMGRVGGTRRVVFKSEGAK